MSSPGFPHTVGSGRYTRDEDSLWIPFESANRIAQTFDRMPTVWSVRIPFVSYRALRTHSQKGKLISTSPDTLTKVIADLEQTIVSFFAVTVQEQEYRKLFLLPGWDECDIFLSQLTWPVFMYRNHLEDFFAGRTVVPTHN